MLANSGAREWFIVHDQRDTSECVAHAFTAVHELSTGQRFRTRDIHVDEKERPSDFGAFIHRVAMKLQTEGQREEPAGRKRKQSSISAAANDRQQFDTTYLPPSCDWKLECQKHLANSRPLVVWTSFLDHPQGHMEVRVRVCVRACVHACICTCASVSTSVSASASVPCARRTRVWQGRCG